MFQFILNVAEGVYLYILNKLEFMSNILQKSICDNGTAPLPVRSKTLICGSLIVGIAGLNPTEGMDVHTRNLCLLCMQQPLRRADNSFRGVLRNLDPFDSNKESETSIRTLLSLRHDQPHYHTVRWCKVTLSSTVSLYHFRGQP
jgi:hypothetical protein